MRTCFLAAGAISLAAVFVPAFCTTSLAADSAGKPVAGVPADWDKIQADPAALAAYRCAKPSEFVLLFSLGHASDLMPQDDARFDRLLAEIKEAGFNTIHCTYTDQRLEMCRKHGIKMMIDFLAEDRRAHVYKNAADCKALCGRLRGNPNVWGYNIWNGNCAGIGAGRQRDILNVRRWDPTHPVFVGTVRDNGVEYLTNADVFGYYDLHWRRNVQMHLGLYPTKYLELARKANSFYYSWYDSTAGKAGEENYRRSLWSANIGIACGQKGILWFLAPMDRKTLQWTPEKDDIARINRSILPIAGELVRLGNPLEVYSTARTKDMNNAALPAGQAGKAPAGFKPFPEDFRIQPAAGEFIMGLFSDGKDDVIYVANHNAFAPQNVRLKLARPMIAVRHGPETPEKPRTASNQIDFELEAGGGQLWRLSQP